MNEKAKFISRILETVHQGARDLFAGGAIDAAQMNKFDEMCLRIPAVPKKNLK